MADLLLGSFVKRNPETWEQTDSDIPGLLDDIGYIYCLEDDMAWVRWGLMQCNSHQHIRELQPITIIIPPNPHALY